MPLFIVVPKLPAAAMAIYPFILIKKAAYKNDAVLVNHEKIHHRQQLELMVIPFYVVYFFNYLFNLLKYKNHDKAYFNIAFEREAFAKEHELTYLKNRALFSWFKWLSR
ncbi:MAG: hypothetical protein EOP00_19015 [Pedobacter sp.]|nr:MAG: hypothetical protein EOP00_19015 [Pedobacter sp.]